ncbi:hypothetical protein [Burkholderia multivorans]|uniref:hypothetical protein n=1 Tax=Burkholderia multivorans TaxID=87883 RepID=UPI0011B68517|nr:hypothetical protein [Burkholderia multivorans]MBR7900150.1 hypothetical protein [Burkholderia multivorans]HEM8495987.1 hypothetical protein [Burkholderia multivorans]
MNRPAVQQKPCFAGKKRQPIQLRALRAVITKQQRPGATIVNTTANYQVSFEEEIDYDCARECLTHAIAICSTYLAQEHKAGAMQASTRAELESIQATLADKRKNIRIHDSNEAKRIRQTLGELIQRYAATREKWISEASKWTRT